MVDREVVERLMHVLERNLLDVRSLAKGRSEPFPDGSVEERAIERCLHVAIQACIDLAMHVLADLPGAMPEQYAELFPALERAGIISGELATKLSDAAKFRNLLVHGYVRIDPDQVFRNVGHLDDLGAFARQLSIWLEKI